MIPLNNSLLMKSFGLIIREMHRPWLHVRFMVNYPFRLCAAAAAASAWGQAGPAACASRKDPRPVSRIIQLGSIPREGMGPVCSCVPTAMVVMGQGVMGLVAEAAAASRLCPLPPPGRRCSTGMLMGNTRGTENPGLSCLF